MTFLKSGWLRTLLPALGLISVLLLFHFFHDPYKELGPDLLTVRAWGDYQVSPWRFSKELAEVRDDGSMATWVDGKKRGGISCRIDGGAPGDLLRLRGEVRSDGIVQGKAGWQGGRIGLIYSDAHNKSRWNYPHTAGVRVGTNNWASVELVSEVQHYAAYGKLWINNWGTSGRYEVRNLSLVPVRAKRSGPYYFWATLICIGALGYWYARRFKLTQRTSGWLVIWIAVAIFAGVLLPGKVVDDAPEVTAKIMQKSVHKVATSASAKKVVPALAPTSSTRPKWVKRKNQVIKWVKRQNAHTWGHGGLFFLFGLTSGIFFLGAGIPTRLYTVHHQDALKVLGLICGVFVFSALAELIQGMSISRTVELDDWLLNIHGATGGLIVFVLCHLGHHPFRRLKHLLIK